TFTGNARWCCDMLPTPHARGCSGNARRTRPRSRQTGRPGPTDVSGRVQVAVEHQPTAGTDVGAHRQALGDPLCAAAGHRPAGQHHTAVLAGVGRQAPRAPDTRRRLPWPSRMVRTAAHRASLLLLTRWWLRTRWRTCTSSREMTSYCCNNARAV